MTVAAVILAASPASALADAAGTPAVRRIADTAWAGGATPVVVVAHDPDGQVAASLATAEVTLLEPAPLEAGPVGQIARGIRGAAGLVAATSAALVWPARFAWADAETATTLVEAHGDDASSLLRPVHGGSAGWPALLLLTALAALDGVGPDRMPEDVIADVVAAGVPLRLVDTGDPGATHDLSVPYDQLPPFDGPPRPDDDVEREWGVPAAEQSDDAPPAGPARLAHP
ncbi:MAG: NTP transferase domain-containing protein [Chloroflexota bacterium]